MSGGVDSSVAAFLLKKQGFEVVGVFMKFWKEGESENRCCSTESYRLARAVAQKIGIPIYSFNLKKEFKKRVVDYYLNEYKRGWTPNPCVVCNLEIKFGLLLDRAKAMNARLATGHYARIEKEKNGDYSFLRGKDSNKDQSYFLWKIAKDDLKNIVFPVGGYKKEKVRIIAKEADLLVAERKDSAGICFIAKKENEKFLKKHLKSYFKKGDIVENSGRLLGHHQGLFCYTIGQRTGLNLGDLSLGKGSISRKPLYVVKIDISKNRLIVGEEKELYHRGLLAEGVNWLDNSSKFKVQSLKLTCEAQIRYQHKTTSCVVEKYKTGCLKVVFQEAQRAITRGQSVVFYQGDKLLGGGVIKSVLK